MKVFRQDKDIILRNFRALVVYDDYIIGAKGYHLYKYDIKKRKMFFYSKIKDIKYSLLSRFFLSRRFFRAEITNFYTLSNGTQLVIAKKGIFIKLKKDKYFKKCFNIKRGSRPLNLCIHPDNSIYFGEYFANTGKKEVYIYCSKNNGISWDIAYTFKAGSINHIHGIFYDKYTNNIWVVTGDRQNECIIGYTTDKFKTFNEVFRGGQEYRSCNLIFYNDYIVYATDSQYIKNKIKYFDRKNLDIKDLFDINGSCIYGGQNSQFAFLSSTMEPSKVNTDNNSCLYFSKDGLIWEEIAKHSKDMWNKMLFQFGSIQFPRYESKLLQNEFIVYSGRALKKIGNSTVIKKYE